MSFFYRVLLVIFHSEMGIEKLVFFQNIVFSFFSVLIYE